MFGGNCSLQHLLESLCCLNLDGKVMFYCKERHSSLFLESVMVYSAHFIRTLQFLPAI